MKKWVKLFIISFFLVASTSNVSRSGSSATVQCDSYKISLGGVITTYGSTYTEIMTLEKIHKSGGAQGKWKLTRFEQIIQFPATLPFSLDKVVHVDMKHGMWIDVKSVAVSNLVHTWLVKSNIVFDVVGNRIGYKDKNVWCGKISGNQATFKWHEENPNEPTLTGPVSLQGERISVNITSPSNDKRYVFSKSVPGQITFTATAKASPSKYNSQLVWAVEVIPGSQIQVEPANYTGPTIKVTYTNLPPANISFGRKKISVQLKVDNCQVETTSNVRLFFPAFATNNPSGSEPNWFYYWKQTSAAIGPVRYIVSSSNCTSEGNRTLGFYNSTFFDSVFYICNLRNLGDDFPYKAKTYKNNIMSNVKVYGIDTFAITCTHENAHYQHYQNWWKQFRTTNKFQDTNRNGILDIKEQDLDKDGDLVPDAIEPKNGLNPNNKNTYGIGPDGNDEEFLCWEAETKWSIGSANKEDWAKPGKQWK